MSRFFVGMSWVAMLLVMTTGFDREPQVDAKAEYEGKCAMCHGATGAGDGPAGAAFNPKPPDFTTAEYQESKTDEDLTTAIADGKGAMPGFTGQLSDDAITAVVAYIRTLGPSGGR